MSCNRLLLLLFLPGVFSLSLSASAQQSTSIPAASSNYGQASYKISDEGKFFRHWLVAGPFRVSGDTSSTPAEEMQEKFFENEQLDSIVLASQAAPPATDRAGRPLTWKPFSSNTDRVLFDSLFPDTDFASCYAIAEINSDRPTKVLLGIGSDEGVKVYHNGRLIHKNWIARGINTDDDIVAVDLVKGSNRLMLFVQDMQGAWGFTARILDKVSVNDKLVLASAKGNLEQMRMMLDRGADINGKGRMGVTPLQAAQINGRKAVERELLKKGASQTSVPSAQQIIEGMYGNLSGENRPGIALLIAREGKIVFKNGYGYSNIPNKVKITPDTKFRIGSITKQFTAAALLKLQEEGKVKITDKLSAYVPGFTRGNDITLHHLLTHTSGIHSYTNTDSFLNKVTKKISANDLVAYIKTMPYDFAPGEKYEYNNSAYFLAGYIVEKVTGGSLDNYLRKKFFEPLGMKNTGIYSADLQLTNEAIGYNKGDKYDTALNWDMSWAGGAGALYSTVEDLYKWNEALFSGKVLNEKSMKEAFTPVVLNNGKTPPGIDYGYGWGLQKYRGLELIGHSGGLHGFVSQLARYPSEQMTVVMLTNQTPVEVELDPSKIAELFLWQKLDSQESYEPVAMKNVDLNQYEGRYDLGNKIIMTFIHENDGLFAQVSGQGKFQVFPLKKDEFFWKVVEARVKFNRDEKGEIVSAYFEQGTFKITALKMTDNKKEDVPAKPEK